MAEQKDNKFNPLKMVIYEFRDMVGDHPKEVLGIRKLAFLQNTTYNETMEGIFHLTQAVYKDYTTGDNGSNEPIVETVTFGNKSAGIQWCPCPFNIQLIASVESKKPLKIKLEGCIEFSARGLLLNEHFDTDIGDDKLEITIINTDRFSVKASITTAVVEDGVKVTFSIPICLNIAGNTVQNTYAKEIIIKG